MNLQLLDLLDEARKVLVFTGAGVSTACGIPDYRGPQGVWNTRRPVTYQEFMASDTERQRYWRQKLEDWQAWGDAEPGTAHGAIVTLERLGRLELLVTQNVDGLHARSGISPERLVEIHGTNAEAACMSCGARSPGATHYDAFAASGVPPTCECGGALKPATISFGQSLVHDDLERSFEAARQADLVLSLGSTLSVTPAADIPLTAARRGIPYVIINRGETEHDGLPFITMRIDGDVGEILVPIMDALEARH